MRSNEGPFHGPQMLRDTIMLYTIAVILASEEEHAEDLSSLMEGIG